MQPIFTVQNDELAMSVKNLCNLFALLKWRNIWFLVNRKGKQWRYFRREEPYIENDWQEQS